MFEFFMHKVWQVWVAGGWTLIPLALLSLVIYSNAVHLFLYFAARDYQRVGRDVWARWVEHPETAEGEIGEIVRYTQEEVHSCNQIHQRFKEVTSARLPLVDRRLRFLNVLITAAPLIGLLGTVLGMLVTFQLISLGGGQITDMMSSGISQALFPPQVGLCVALPGLAMAHVIKRKRTEYEGFLARLESLTLQHYRRRVAREPMRPRSAEAATVPSGAILMPA
jgi:biopolymer transport protein ExbB